MMTTAEKIKVMQAFVDGKPIQLKSETGEWEDWNREVCGEPYWTWNAEGDKFRIKPEPAELWAWVHPTHPASPILAQGREQCVGAWVKKKFREVV